MTVQYKNQKAHVSSKTQEVVYITGAFEVTEKVLNGRTKVIKEGTTRVYWVELPKEEQPTQAVVENASVNNTLPRVVYHCIKDGDTLEGICSRYGLEVSQLSSTVQLPLVPGQLIRVI